MSIGRLEGLEWQGELRVPVIAQCGDSNCQFKWPIAYTPQNLMVTADLMQKATCPMCGHKHPTIG